MEANIHTPALCKNVIKYVLYLKFVNTYLEDIYLMWHSWNFMLSSDKHLTFLGIL